MNRDILNQYFQSFFADEESLSSDVRIRWQKQCLYIDENMYKNPISLVGDNSDTDVASSENISFLVNAYSDGINIEEAYLLIIRNLKFKGQFGNALKSGLTVSSMVVAENSELQYSRLVNMVKEKIRNEL